MEKAIILSLLLGLAFAGGYAAGEESAASYFSKQSSQGAAQ